MKPQFMIKYGKKEHLQQIVDGKLRFAPSQAYVEMENTLGNKGQGDQLEGKMKIKVEGFQIGNTNSMSIKVVPKAETYFTLSVQDVNSKPIFCLSQYGSNNIVKCEKQNKYKIQLPEDKLECIKNDFQEATHALIILEPDKFISDVKKIKDYQINSDEIKYYNYKGYFPMENLAFLTTGGTEIKKTGSMTDEKTYRHLLCKDIVFEKQQEYRFIIMDELISEPKVYSFDFTSKYLLVPIEKLSSPLEVS